MRPFQMFALIIIATSVVNCAPVRRFDPVADRSESGHKATHPSDQEHSGIEEVSRQQSPAHPPGLELPGANPSGPEQSGAGRSEEPHSGVTPYPPQGHFAGASLTYPPSGSGNGPAYHQPWSAAWLLEQVKDHSFELKATAGALISFAAIFTLINIKNIIKSHSGRSIKSSENDAISRRLAKLADEEPRFLSLAIESLD